MDANLDLNFILSTLKNEFCQHIDVVKKQIEDKYEDKYKELNATHTTKFYDYTEFKILIKNMIKQITPEMLFIPINKPTNKIKNDLYVKIKNKRKQFGYLQIDECNFAYYSYNKTNYDTYNINHKLCKPAFLTELKISITFAFKSLIFETIDFLDKIKNTLVHVKELYVVLTWKKYGHYCNISYDEKLFTQFFNKLIDKIISLFPNLKSLRVHNCDYNSDYVGHESQNYLISPTNNCNEFILINKIIKKLMLHIPHFNHIEYLSQNCPFYVYFKNNSNRILKKNILMRDSGITVKFTATGRSINY